MPGVTTRTKEGGGGTMPRSATSCSNRFFETPGEDRYRRDSTGQKIAAIAGEKRDNGARNSISILCRLSGEKRRETRRGAGDTQIIADFHDVPGQSSVIRALLAGVLAGVKFNLSGPK